jgi:hypothetical protein
LLFIGGGLRGIFASANWDYVVDGSGWRDGSGTGILSVRFRK